MVPYEGLSIEAMAAVQANGVPLFARGCSVVKGAAGVYTVNLDRPCPITESITILLVRGGAGNTTAQEAGNDNLRAVNTHVAAVLTDAAFDILILRASDATP